MILIFCSIVYIPEDQLQNPLFYVFTGQFSKIFENSFPTLKPLILIIQITQPGRCSLSVRMKGWSIKQPHREMVLVAGAFPVCEEEQSMSLTC